MSLPGECLPVLPCFSVIYREPRFLAQCCDILQGEMGRTVLRGGPFPFDMTGYYEGEMGDALLRKWLCFPLAQPSGLPIWKLFCVEAEGHFGGQGERRVNIDPGYLDHGKLVLGSCKAAPDKIYLHRGVYAHTCLRYRAGELLAPDHSFADFRDGRFNRFFLGARALYKKLLREQPR